MRTLTCCPGCQSTDIGLLETVPVAKLAAAWADYFAEAQQLLLGYAQRGEMPDPILIHRCRACTLEFASPQYAAGSEWYAVVEQYLDRWEYGQTLSDLPPAVRLLEIGCGEGIFLDRARQQGHHVVGLDFNASALQIAAAKGLEVHPWDLRELAQRLDRQFDAVTLYHVIEHIPDLDAFFADLNQIATPHVKGMLKFGSAPGLVKAA